MHSNHHYGYYSNKTRGQRRLRQPCAAGITPVALSAPETEPDGLRRHCKRAWARLIRKAWAADPLEFQHIEIQQAVPYPTC